MSSHCPLTIDKNVRRQISSTWRLANSGGMVERGWSHLMAAFTFSEFRVWIFCLSVLFCVGYLLGFFCLFLYGFFWFCVWVFLGWLMSWIPLIRQQEEAQQLQKQWCRLQAWMRRESYLLRSYKRLTQLSHVKKISFLNWSLHNCRTTFSSARKTAETRKARHNHSSPYLSQLKVHSCLFTSVVYINLYTTKTKNISDSCKC